MKYELTLLTPKGQVTEQYTDSETLQAFESRMKTKYNTFIQLGSKPLPEPKIKPPKSHRFEHERNELIQVCRILLIAIKEGDLTIFPASDTTPNYIQILENKLNELEP